MRSCALWDPLFDRISIKWGKYTGNFCLLPLIQMITQGKRLFNTQNLFGMVNYLKIMLLAFQELMDVSLEIRSSVVFDWRNEEGDDICFVWMSVCWKLDSSL